MPHTGKRRSLLASAAALTVVLAVACSGGPSKESGSGEPSGAPSTAANPPSPADPAGPMRYVALGDSYTAAPLVPTTDGTDPCLRSTGNYPRLVAASRDDIELVDVSCGGASSASMTQPHDPRGIPRPPQFDALTADTDLVTVSIGGNDFDLYGSLIYQCVGLARSQRSGSPCLDRARSTGADPRDRFDAIQANVEAVIEGIRERSPEARILVVTYPQIVPAKGTCPAVLPLASGDYPFARDVMASLSQALVDAANATGVEYVDVYAASAGHDICSAAPWVNGAVRDPERAGEFHPFPEEQRAVADLILEML